jgi:PAS domain S-box-containing protein
MFCRGRNAQGGLFMNLKRHITPGHYLVCILSVAAATGLTLSITALRDIHSLAFFLVAVVISAFYGGLYPAILAIVLSALCFDYFVAPPSGWGISSPQDRIRLLSFVAVAFFFSLLHGQREKAEDKLRSMAQRLTLALEGTKLAVWDLDLDTGVVWHSAGLEELFGRTADRFARSYEVFLGYVHSEDRDFVHRTIMRATEKGQEYHIQYRITLPSGEARWVATRGRVFLDTKGHPERLVAVTTDITNQPEAALPPSVPAPSRVLPDMDIPAAIPSGIPVTSV